MTSRLCFLKRDTLTSRAATEGAVGGRHVSSAGTAGTASEAAATGTLRVEDVGRSVAKVTTVSGALLDTGTSRVAAMGRLVAEVTTMPGALLDTGTSLVAAMGRSVAEVTTVPGALLATGTSQVEAAGGLLITGEWAADSEVGTVAARFPT